MKDLKPLVDLISRNKIKQIEVAGLPGRGRSKVQQLYQAIAENRFESEEEAARFFFEEGELQSTYFARLKRQLRERLINTLFFIDANQPSFNEYQRAYYTCYKYTTAVKIMLGRYARSAAIPLAEHTLKKAMEFEFTDLIFELSKILLSHYGHAVGDFKKYQTYRDLFFKYSEIYRAENLSETYRLDIAQHFARSKATKTEIAILAEKYFHELDNIPKEHRSYRFFFQYYLISLLRYEIINDYANTLRISLEALAYFEQARETSASNLTILNSFLNHALACYLRLERHKEGEAIAQRLLKINAEGSVTWYNTLLYYLIMCLHSEQYQKAYKVFKMATEHPSYSHLHQNIREYWLVVEAFIHYFISIHRIKPERELKSAFRINRFVNKVPTYSKDKQGTNISILILQVLFLLQQGKYNEIIDRMESLKMYVHRHLRQDDTYRSNCFIKMLLTLPKANFHKNGVIRTAKKFHDLLLAVPLVSAKQSAELEIVPYETLWDCVLQSLDNKFH